MCQISEKTIHSLVHIEYRCANCVKGFENSELSDKNIFP